MPHDLVVFGEDWGRHPSSTQHIVRRLAADRGVIWVNSLGLRRPRFDRRDLARLVAKGKSLISHRTAQTPKQVAEHPFRGLVDPRALPFPGSAIAGAVNRRLLARQLAPAMRSAGLDRPILWTSLPTAVPVVGALGERAVVYYAGDDFAALAGVDHGPVLRAEAELAGKADLILAASPEIACRFDAAKTVVIPHGVDFERFFAPAPRVAELPTGPVAGFYGSINDWIDVDTLAATADEMPDWTFVMIGRVETDVTALRQRPNLLFQPAMPHQELARWSQHWDVSLLPFRRNRQIDASNPLKLREYLAAGRPVAATYRFNAIRELGAPVATACERSSFAMAIRQAAAMREDVLEWRPKLSAHTWEARASQVSELLDNL